MTDLVIVGTGGLGREVHQIVEDLNQDGAQWNLLGFIDDDPDKGRAAVHDLPVLGPSGWLEEHPDVVVVLGVGATPARRRLAASISETGGNRFATLVHPLAWIGDRVSVGEGTVIFPGTQITTDIGIGRHVVLNPGCTVGHDSVVADFVTMASGVNVSGNDRIGEGCDLGAGAALIQGVSVGEWSILGAGAVVVRDVPANVTAVGVPAQPIKERPRGWHEGPR